MRLNNQLIFSLFYWLKILFHCDKQVLLAIFNDFEIQLELVF